MRVFRVVFLVVAAVLFLRLGIGSRVNSANLTNVSDTLSTSRLSFVGREASGNSVGSGIVNIDATPNAYESTSSANLFTNDWLAIGNGGLFGQYQVTGITSPTQIQVNPVLAAGQATAGQFIIATRSATHTISFTTVSAVPNGGFRVLIPAVSNAANARDGIPDQGGFDFNAGPSVTCPTNTAGYGFTTGVATPSAQVINGITYHAFTCNYAGTGTIGQVFTNGIVIGTTNPLINPAPKANHVEGTADTYTFVLQQLDTTGTVIDQTIGGLAVVESVRVTATVDPQITFRVGGVTNGITACGLTTSITTTSTSIPFGSVAISSFTNAAQALSVSTNAVSGYAVTAIQNDQLGRNGNACVGGGPTFANPCIPDSIGDDGTMTASVTDAWNNSSVKGFAYTLADPNTSTTPAFTYTNGFRKFADQEQSQAPVGLFSGTSVADNANVYVCYRIVIGATQQAGDYTNNLTYRATATF